MPARGNVPAFAHVAALLRARILAGDLAPGTRIPSEPAIIREFGVSKTTAERAVRLLEAEQLVIRRVGVGSFVAADIPAVLVITAAPGSRITAAMPSAAEARADDRLELPPGVPVLQLEAPGRAPARYPADRTVIVVPERSGTRRGRQP